MKQSKINLFLSVFFSLALSTLALAESTAVKMEVSPFKKAFPDSYAATWLSQIHKQKHTRYDYGYQLGSKFLDKNLDFNASFGLKKRVGDSKVYLKSVDLETSYKLFTHENISLTPYAQFTLPRRDSSGSYHELEGRTGIEAPLSYAVNDKLSVEASYDVSWFFGTKANETEVLGPKPVNPASVGDTVDNEPVLHGEKNPALNMRHDIALELAYRLTEKLRFELKSVRKFKNTPKLAYSKESGSYYNPKKFSSLGIPEYSSKVETKHRLRASYSFTKTLFVQNDVYLISEGEKSYGVINALSVVASLL